MEWLRNYNHTAFIRGMVKAGEGIASFLQTLIVYFGAMVVLALLLVVEQQRIMHGMVVFEVNHSLAFLGAFALVILALTMEYQIYHIEGKAGYKHEHQYRPSLRIAFTKFLYWLGYGKDWTPHALSPAESYRKFQRLLTSGMLVLALLGSMKPAMEARSGVTWFEAMGDIVTKSTLLEMNTWLGGLLFALIAVMGSQRLTGYLALRSAEILAEMDAEDTPAAEIPAPVFPVITYINTPVEEDTAEVVAVPLEVSQTDTPLTRHITFRENGRHSLVEQE